MDLGRCRELISVNREALSNRPDTKWKQSHGQVVFHFKNKTPLPWADSNEDIILASKETVLRRVAGGMSKSHMWL